MITEHQLRIIFVLILCAPVAYFGVRFFMSLVNNAVAGKRTPVDKKAKAREDAEAETSERGKPPVLTGRRRKPGRRS
ncbi:MAG: hypothetical protein LBS67_04160 [Clostridiales Family XIII bacterium]|jgi:hypothetical protein|nr:hypothetical protein [Clostridiales Family XIII bacterium]